MVIVSDQVWDLRNQLCLQTLVDGSTYTPDNTLSALTYSPARKMLVSGAYYIKPWPLTDTRGTGGAGHRDPVSWVAYNHMFAEVRGAGELKEEQACYETIMVSCLERHQQHPLYYTE